MNEFGLWISQEIDHRGWTRSEVARRGGISPSTIDKVINEFSKPGPKLCLALARAFNMPNEDVMRLAGILPPKPPTILAERSESYRITGRTYAEQILAIINDLPDDDKRLILQIATRLTRIQPRIIGAAATEDQP